MDVGNGIEAKNVPGLERALLLARAALFWERFWLALWPLLGLLGVFVFLSLVGFWGLLPGWLHLAALGALVGLGGYWLHKGFKNFKVPDRAEARRRVERNSGLKHRPLTALDDRLANTGTGGSDTGTRHMWLNYRRAVARGLGRLRVGAPSLGLARRDPLGLRVVVVLGLIVGFAAAGGDWPQRLADGLAPRLSSATAIPASVNAWITPPGYTGAAPIYLTAPAKTGAGPDEQPVENRAVRLPAGSLLVALLHGGRGVPLLKLHDRDMELEEVGFEAVDEENQRAELQIDSGQRLTLTQGRRVVAAWNLEVIPDQAPTVEFDQAISATKHKVLKLAYKARDDYGLAGLEAQLVLRGSDPLPLDGPAPVRILLPIPAVPDDQGGISVEATSYQDLTPHPWAGLDVALRLAALDDMGQVGYSAAERVTLPEREFLHPVALDIITQRKILAANPARKDEVGLVLGLIAEQVDAYGQKMDVYLGLTSAQRRLEYDQSDVGHWAVLTLLWDVALAVEDDARALAQQDLRQLQEELMEALASGAPAAELERLIDKLQRALDDYLRALAAESWRPEQGVPLDGSTAVVRADDLSRLLDQMKELSATGATGAARDLLAMLQDILENLSSGPAMGGGEEAQVTLQSLKDLNKLIEKQQELLDRTYRRMIEGDAPRDNNAVGPRPPEGAATQERLRRELGAILENLGGVGKIPQPLGEAEGAMRDAHGALVQSWPRAAVNSQTRAIDRLRAGAEELVGKMMSGGGGGRGNSSAFDPLGRALPRFGRDGNDTRIPEDEDIQQAREILEELRRRASEMDRPAKEREYLKRLLKRF